MKKSVVLCAVFSALFWIVPAHKAGAQYVELGAITQSLMQTSHAEQVIKYVMMIENQVKQIENSYNQFQTMLKQQEMALNNIKGVTNVKNFGDFMKWYNRQAYLEQQAENRFTTMGIKIGGKNYTYQQITDIPSAALNEFDYNNTFGRDLSEAERREVYMRLGMSSTAYAYTRTWEERNKVLYKAALTAQETKAKENEDMVRGHEELVNKYKDDANKAETEKITEKTLQMDANILTMETNRQLGSLNEQIALQNDMNATNKMREGSPDSAVTIQNWNSSSFKPLVEVSVEEE